MQHEPESTIPSAAHWSMRYQPQRGGFADLVIVDEMSEGGELTGGAGRQGGPVPSQPLQLMLHHLHQIRDTCGRAATQNNKAVLPMQQVSKDRHTPASEESMDACSAAKATVSKQACG